MHWERHKGTAVVSSFLHPFYSYLETSVKYKLRIFLQKKISQYFSKCQGHEIQRKTEEPTYI